MKHINRCDIGPLSKKATAKHRSFAPIQFDIPSRITNASTRERYTGENWNIRAGAEKKHLSFGMGA